jgi:hypothetical protein
MCGLDRLESCIYFELPSGVSIWVILQSCDVTKVRDRDLYKGGGVQEVLTKLPELFFNFDIRSIRWKLKIAIVIAGQVSLDHGAWSQARTGKIRPAAIV